MAEIAAVRQTYHVFEAQNYFFVLSFALSKARKGSDTFQRRRPGCGQLRTKACCGRSGVTAKDVVSTARRTRHVSSSLAALNILYVLVALEQATLLRAGAHRQLFFSVRKTRKSVRP